MLTFLAGSRGPEPDLPPRRNWYLRAWAIGSRLFGLGNDRVTLKVPPDHGAALVEALLHLYQAKAETLHQRANELIRGEAAAESLLGARDELGSLEQAIGQLGWDLRGPKVPVEVTAERSLLRQAVLVSIDETGDQLSEHCTALLRGEGTAGAIGTQIERLRGLLELLREAEVRRPM